MNESMDHQRRVGGALLFGLLIIGGLSSCQSSTKAELATPLETVLFATPADSSVACYRIPALTQTPNGTLLAAIDERVPSCADLNGSRDINIVLRSSTDGGATWSPIQRVADFHDGIAASDPSFITDERSGTVFLFYNVMDHDSSPGRYRFYVMRSNDDGASWSSPTDITNQLAKPEWVDDFMFITSGRGIQSREGILLHTLVNLQRGVHVFQSEDAGASWSLVEHPLVPGDESKIVELGDGTWMVNSRVSEVGHRWVHTSTDAGLSWSSRPDTTLVDPASNAAILALHQTGGLAFLNANHPSSRENLSIRISEDNGATWSLPLTLFTGSAAYVSADLLENGDVGVFYERNDYRENVFRRVRITSVDE